MNKRQIEIVVITLATLALYDFVVKPFVHDLTKKNTSTNVVNR